MKLVPVEQLISDKKCKIHRAWIKKGVCELCLMEQRKLEKQQQRESGVKPSPVIIRKI